MKSILAQVAVMLNYLILCSLYLTVLSRNQSQLTMKIFQIISLAAVVNTIKREFLLVAVDLLFCGRALPADNHDILGLFVIKL